MHLYWISFFRDEGRAISNHPSDKSSGLINQFRHVKRNADAPLGSPGWFLVSNALDPKIRIYIFMQRSSSCRRIQRKEVTSTCAVCEPRRG